MSVELTVREPDLIEVLSAQVDDFIRFVRKSDNESVRIKLQNIAFTISQITGLQDALDEKMNLVEAIGDYFEGFAVVNASGQVVPSAFVHEVISNLLDMQDIYSGIAVPDSTPITDPVMGDVYGIIAFDDTSFGAYERTKAWQIVLASTGLYLRSMVGASWSVPIYAGAARNCIQVTYDELTGVDGLMTVSKLTPGAQYMLTDYGHDNGIILTAATENKLKPDGIRLLLIPAYSVAGEYGGYTWGGTWNINMDAPTIDTYYNYCGFVYKSLTGAVGTATNYILDSTNWQQIATSETAFYTQYVIGCTYTVVSPDPTYWPKGYVSSGYDKAGNEFREDVARYTPPIFRNEYNDWTHCYAGMVYNVKVARFYGNRIEEPTAKVFYDITGPGAIYDNHRTSCGGITIGSASSYIAQNVNMTLTNSVLDFESWVLQNGSNSTSVTISGCAIGGEIESNPTLTLTDIRLGKSGDIKRSSGSVTESVVDGDIKDCDYIGISKSFIETQAELDNCTTVYMTSSTMKASSIAKDFARFSLSGSIYDTNSLSQTGVEAVFQDSYIKNIGTQDGTTQIIRQSAQNKIIGEFYIGPGTFTIPSGAGFSLPNITSGCTVTVDRENGVTVDSSDRVFLVKYTGYYRIHVSTSCTVSSASIVEAGVHKNGVLIQQLYNKKKYNTTDSWQTTTIPVYGVWLSEGDLIDIRYKHDSGSTITVTLGQINISLEYDN